MGAMFFIYVAMENGIGIWSAEYAKRLANGITGMTTLAPCFSMPASHRPRKRTAGSTRLPERKIVLGALSLAAAATALLIASRSLPIATVAVFLAGLDARAFTPFTLPGSRDGMERARNILGASSLHWLLSEDLQALG